MAVFLFFCLNACYAHGVHVLCVRLKEEILGARLLDEIMEAPVSVFFWFIDGRKS
jgi:hypothetical protein